DRARRRAWPRPAAAALAGAGGAALRRTARKGLNAQARISPSIPRAAAMSGKEAGRPGSRSCAGFRPRPRHRELNVALETFDERRFGEGTVPRGGIFADQNCLGLAGTDRDQSAAVEGRPGPGLLEGETQLRPGLYRHAVPRVHARE